MKQKRTGVLIGPALTEKYGWKEGDRVTGLRKTKPNE